MKKKYVFDTNVLLYDPQAIFKFDDNDVIIPITVIEEIDNFKKDENETGRNARQVSRFLDDLRKKGNLSQGVLLENGGNLTVDLGNIKQKKEFKTIFTKRKADSTILAIAMNVKARSDGQPVIFVTKDTNLRIRADALGLNAVDYEPNVVAIDELYKGWREILLKSERIDEMYAKGRIPAPPDLKLLPNEMVLLRDEVTHNHTSLAKYSRKTGNLSPIREFKEGVWGIAMRNKEQSFAMDLLLNDELKLVTLVGKAGTGKTLLAIAAGLSKTTDENVYNRLLVSRPVFPLGKDIGFLPGELEEKLMPWMQPIYDNIEFLLGVTSKQRKKGSGYSYKELINLGMLSIEPLTYIRGRSIPNQFMIVDEAQNLTPHEIKTIISRVGYGTKIIITGDPYQIDNPYVDSSNNGLTYVVERFKNEDLAGHITLIKGERSELAELAANIL
jgi:PhoH-like ATPase